MTNEKKSKNYEDTKIDDKNLKIQDKFNEAAAKIKQAGENLNLSNDDLLTLYGYYKQSTIGDCNTEPPGFFDVRGKAKYDEWYKNKGMSANDAMKRYTKKVSKLIS